MKVKDHIEHLWRNESELLGLMFGRYYPRVKSYQGTEECHYNNDTLGAKMFFLNKLLVPPNRFRPESQGAFGGAGASSGDRSFLHAHSAMLTKILTANLLLKDALLNKENSNTNEGDVV